MGLVSNDDGWRVPDWLWARVEPLLPAPASHPLGCHNPRVSDRDAMDAILLVLRTGMQWNALNATGICSSSSAHRRFQEWEQAGVFHEILAAGAARLTRRSGSTGRGSRVTGRRERRRLGAERPSPNPTDRAKGGETFLLCEARGVPIGVAHDGTTVTTQGSCPDARLGPDPRPDPSLEQPRRLCLDGG